MRRLCREPVASCRFKWCGRETSTSVQRRRAHVAWKPVRHFIRPQLAIRRPELSEVQVQATSHDLESHGVCILLLLQCKSGIEHALMVATVSCMPTDDCVL